MVQCENCGPLQPLLYLDCSYVINYMAHVQNSDQGVLPIYPFKQMHITESENSKIIVAAEGIVTSMIKVNQ